jgi:hypothetical protein
LAKRKTITKKLRFEVFKRDNFTCQYCGKSAPDVILEVDHINPVKNNGDNNILNLITSCKDCNRGKGAKELTENQVLKQQQEQLKELNEKREQLKLMLKWKKELENFDNEQIDIIDNIIYEEMNSSLTKLGRENIKKYIKKFGISEVMESTNISIKQYYKNNDESSIKKVMNHIPKICNTRLYQKDNPNAGHIRYIAGVMHNRFNVRDNRLVTKALAELVIDEESYEIILGIAKEARSWGNFWFDLNNEYGTDY